MSTAKDGKSRQPWRDNIEAMTVAIIMAVMFKYFALEAYQIPTGSMQPTLMGQDFEPEPPNAPKAWYVKGLDFVFGAGGSIKDRILVDKLSFHFRDPQRWEVVIFKYPLNRAQNFVKRLVGMPGEQLRIRGGDLEHRANANENWRHLRRPPAVLDAQLKALDMREPRDGVHWATEPGSTGSAVADGRACTTDGDVTLRFAAHGGRAIFDTYSHGYPVGMQERLPTYGNHEVGDLRATGRVRASAGLESFVIELRETGHSYQFEIPGPAASTSATPRISSEARLGAPNPISEKLAAAYRLPAGDWVRYSAQNIDDLLTLEIDGDVVAELELRSSEPTPGAAPESGVFLHLTKGRAELDDLQVWRDIYYTQLNDVGEEGWLIPKDQYFMLGDNTQNSSDSREWKRADLGWNGMPAELTSLGGNQRGNRDDASSDANPIQRRIDRELFTFFRDMWGELWIFKSRDELVVKDKLPAYEPAPFVPRNLITGRAVAVFWPLSIKYATFRWKWVR